ncbi:hypothetical protein KIW84_031476 [Lathyrus oleraceus]|uniref:Transposase n=1 Tax=Pisum sativum TaxID=3888 RepID=A0A9D4XQL7_PEA|nr:hypothetical protein KIW84_031476 [Pisum sativum]
MSEFLTDWGIEKKIFIITLDNASANDIMQQTLKTQLALQNWLLCKGEFFHVRCSAHILNLIVQEGLKVAFGALPKIRETIKHVKGSESRMVKFKQCIDMVGNIDISSGSNVPTRWNSTYLMLKSALKYKCAFENLHCYDANYTSNPSKEDWLENIKLKLYKLFAEYSISSSNASSIPPTTSSTMSTEPSLFDKIRLDRQQSSTTKRNGQSQLDMYLEETALDLDYT